MNDENSIKSAYIVNLFSDKVHEVLRDHPINIER